MPSLWPRKKWLKHLNLCMGSSPFLFFFLLSLFTSSLRRVFWSQGLDFGFFFFRSPELLAQIAKIRASNCLKCSCLDRNTWELRRTDITSVLWKVWKIVFFPFASLLHYANVHANLPKLLNLEEERLSPGPSQRSHFHFHFPPRSVISISISRMLNINVSVGRLNLESCIAIRNSNAVSKFNEFMFVSFVSILERPYVICCPATVAYWISLFCKKKKSGEIGNNCAPEFRFGFTKIWGIL